MKERSQGIDGKIPLTKESASPTDNFKERSGIAQEIIRQKSGILERWSLGLFMLLLLGLLGSSWWVKVPDMIKADAVLHCTDQPQEILPAQSGEIRTVLVKSNQPVQDGEILGWLDPNANVHELIQLSKQLDSAASALYTKNPAPIDELFATSYMHLGSIEDAYLSLIHASRLYASAPGTLEKNGPAIQYNKIEQPLLKLRSKLQQYITANAILSPGDGIVSFRSSFQEHQLVDKNILVGHLVSSHAKYYMELALEQAAMSKLDTGMKVELRLDAYPYQQSGIVPGILTAISTGGIDSFFIGHVELNSGLTTTKNKSIPYKNGLTGKAIIFTKETRLSDKLLGPLIGWLNNVESIFAFFRIQFAEALIRVALTKKRLRICDKKTMQHWSAMLTREIEKMQQLA